MVAYLLATVPPVETGDQTIFQADMNIQYFNSAPVAEAKGCECFGVCILVIQCHIVLLSCLSSFDNNIIVHLYRYVNKYFSVSQYDDIIEKQTQQAAYRFFIHNAQPQNRADFTIL